jgi:methylthioxylose transferase
VPARLRSLPPVPALQAHRWALAAAAVAFAVVVCGLIVRASTGGLGVATPPFVMHAGVAADALGLVAAVAAGAAMVALGPRLLRAPRAPGAFALAAFALALALGLAVNAARHGTRGWSAIFDLGPGGSFEAKNEALAGLPALRYGAGFLLDRFAELVPSLPVNVAGHPPGQMLLVDWLGIDSAGGLAALCVAAAAAVAPLSYALGRTLGLGERRARTGALLTAASPALVLFGVTSADALFAALGTATACLLAARAPWARALGALALAVAAFASWALLAVGAWAAVLAWRRDGWRPALALAAGCAAVVIAFNLVLAAATGYDPIGTLRATEAYYRGGVSAVRPWWFWVLGSPVAFALMLGLPTAWAWLTAIERRVDAALAIGAVVAVAALLGFTKGEVERIWLPFVPLACVAAAAALPDALLRPALAALVAQALALELLFDTIW